MNNNIKMEDINKVYDISAQLRRIGDDHNKRHTHFLKYFVKISHFIGNNSKTLMRWIWVCSVIQRHRE